MVCLYDGNVYSIAQAELAALDSEGMFQFFNDGHKEDIFAVYDEDNQYVGAITYHSLLSASELSGAVTDEKLYCKMVFGIMQALFWRGKRAKHCRYLTVKWSCYIWLNMKKD